MTCSLSEYAKDKINLPATRGSAALWSRSVFWKTSTETVDLRQVKEGIKKWYFWTTIKNLLCLMREEKKNSFLEEGNFQH